MKRKFTCLYVLVSTFILSLCVPLNAAGQQSIKEITVSADGSGDFTSITGALDSITDASESKRYRIKVNPGTYSERITVKSHVHIRGSGQEKTRVTSQGDGPTVEWDAEDATLESLTVTVEGTPEQVISIDKSAVLRNVRVIIPGGTRSGISGGKGSSLEVIGSRIISDSNRKGYVFAISTDGDSLSVANSVIQMNTAWDAWAVGIYTERAGQANISDTVIKLNGYGYGVMSARETEITGSQIALESSFKGKPDDSIGVETRGKLRISHSLITVKTTNPSSNTTALNILKGNTVIEKATVSGSLDGITVHDGTVDVNMSAIAGVSSAVRKTRRGKGSFRIANSLITGEHNGVKGTDKIIDCYDEDKKPIPQL